jgi:hypothetical protein
MNDRGLAKTVEELQEAVAALESATTTWRSRRR